MSEQEIYPYDDGDTIILGPQIFASKDGAVINWQGINYVPMEDPDAPVPALALWTCKIGEVSRSILSGEADGPMRRAVEKAYKEETGHDPIYIFSGWGSRLEERERAVVEDRMPRGPLHE